MKRNVNSIDPLPLKEVSLAAGLRALQGRKELEKLVKRVKSTRDSMPWGAAGPPPLLVKVGARRATQLASYTPEGSSRL